LDGYFMVDESFPGGLLEVRGFEAVSRAEELL
jgi:hypothetical protein